MRSSNRYASVDDEQNDSDILQALMVAHRHTGVRIFLAFVLLAVVLFLCYSNTFKAAWHLDDYPNIPWNGISHQRNYQVGERHDKRQGQPHDNGGLELNSYSKRGTDPQNLLGNRVGFPKTFGNRFIGLGLGYFQSSILLSDSV